MTSVTVTLVVTLSRLGQGMILGPCTSVTGVTPTPRRGVVTLSRCHAQMMWAEKFDKNKNILKKILVVTLSRSKH